MPNYLWQCVECEVYERIQRPMKDSSIPPDESTENSCTHTWEKRMEAPMVLKESWPDGHRMQNNQDYANLARSSQLDLEAYEHRPGSDERKAIEKESKILKGEDTSTTTRTKT